MPKKKSLTSEDVLTWLKNQVDRNLDNQITNWHLNDDIEEFMSEICTDKTNVKQAQNLFAKYARVLADYGYLGEPKRVGIGCGGMYEFGTRTQTIWKRNNSFLMNIEPTEAQRSVGMKMCQLEHKFFKKHGRLFEKRIVELLKNKA